MTVIPLHSRRPSRKPQRPSEHTDHARLLWRMGYLSPHRITIYLDLNDLEGPGVDTVCGVAEPRVDEWEAGKVYPTFEQMCALADLMEVRPDVLCIQPGQINSYMDTSMRFHVPRGERGPAIGRQWFSPSVVAATPGTYASGYRP